MPVTGYVLVPVQKYHFMEEQIQQQQHAKSQNQAAKEKVLQQEEVEEGNKESSKTPSEDEEPVEPTPSQEEKSKTKEAKKSEEENSLEQNEDKRESGDHLSKTMKKMVRQKSLHNRHFLKLLEAIEKYEGEDLKFSNAELVALVKAAVGQSKRTLPKEEEFYKFIIDKNLMYLLRNKTKIRKWVPLWWRLE